MLVLIVGLITGTEQINAERPKDETNIPSSQGCPLCIMCRVLGVGGVSVVHHYQREGGSSK